MLMQKEWGVTIERPIAEVFEAYVDHLGDLWAMGELEPITSGPIGTGTSFRQVGEAVWGFRDPSTVIEVVGFEPARALLLSWNVEVPLDVDFQQGFSTLANTSAMPGWGSVGTLQVHFLELAPNRTRLVILGRNRISHWLAQIINPITRWFGYWWIGRQHRKLKSKLEGPRELAGLPA